MFHTWQDVANHQLQSLRPFLVHSAAQFELQMFQENRQQKGGPVTLAAAQMSPHTTFQPLSFAPKFPLATIAKEYITPPTYRSFLESRSQHEPEVDGTTNVDMLQVQFSRPGLPVPTPAPLPRP